MASFRKFGSLIVAAGLLLAACDPGESKQSETPRPTQPTPNVQVADEPMPFAYLTDDNVGVLKAGNATRTNGIVWDLKTVAKVDLEPDERAQRVEWVSDDRHLVAATSSRLLSVDVESGKVVSQPCQCGQLAIAGGRVYTLASYGAPVLVIRDLTSLAVLGELRPNGVGARGMMQIAGAGDQVVVFAITEDGARPYTDVLMLNPGTGATRLVGKTDELGSPGKVVYTAHGWSGRPVVAYATNQSSGADSSKASVVWFDPESGAQHVLDVSAHAVGLGEKAAANSLIEDMWWGRDGTLHLPLSTWDTIEARTEPRLWRYDGVAWLRVPDPLSETASPSSGQVRGLGGDTWLTLNGDKTLSSVRGSHIDTIARNVTGLSTPARTSASVATAVTIVDLNAAMGYHLGPGDPAGTDATVEDLRDLADDILTHNADIANLQEMAHPAAETVAQILKDRTGQQWILTWSTSADDTTYYEGRQPGEGGAPGYSPTRSGNAQLVRIGYGINAWKPITGEDGVKLKSGKRSYSGGEVTTAAGNRVAVYNTHLARDRDATEPQRVADIRQIQDALGEQSPSVLTGDFNESIDKPEGGPTESAIRALQDFTKRFGYIDIARDLSSTSNQKGPAAALEGHLRIDYILARGVPTQDTVRFVSHQSDHWGLATTIF